MTRLVQAPEVEKKTDDPLADTIERHPAYGAISAHRFTGSRGKAGGFPMYGSDFSHSEGISITISRSELHRGLSRDWPFSREQLIEVHLSEAQWATFISTLNVGHGAQCTLRWVNGEQVPDIAEPPRRKEQFQNELKERLAEAVKTLGELEKLVEDGRKVPLREAVQSLKNQLAGSLPFVADQFNEHVEKVTESAKVEIAAYLGNAISRAGLKALGSEPPVIELPSATSPHESEDLGHDDCEVCNAARTKGRT